MSSVNIETVQTTVEVSEAANDITVDAGSENQVEVTIGRFFEETIVSGPQGPQGVQGLLGDAGASGNLWSSGTAAASGGSSGDFYLKTDVQKIFQNVGGNWQEVANIVDGSQGFRAGAAYIFDGLSVASDPATGRIRFNVAQSSFSSITEVYIDDLGSDTITDWQGVFRTFGDSTEAVKGRLSVESRASGDNSFAIFDVTGVTEEAGYFKLTVSPVSGANLAIGDGENVVLNFSRTGNKGTDGTVGRAVLNGNTDPVSEGAEGDFFINNSNKYIFGPKTGGSWGTGTSLVGPTGAAGGATVDEIVALSIALG